MRELQFNIIHTCTKTYNFIHARSSPPNGSPTIGIGASSYSAKIAHSNLSISAMTEHWVVMVIMEHCLSSTH